MAKKETVAPGTRRTTVIEEPLNGETAPNASNRESLPPPQEPEQLIPGEVSDLGFLPQPEPEEVQMLLSELGDEDHKVVVYRFSKELKKFARLESYSHKEFSLDTLADTYGGGKYRIYVFRPNGQILHSKVIDIDELKKPKPDASQVVQTAQGTQVIMPPQQDMTKVMDMMVSQSERNQALMMTMMTKMAEAMGAVHAQPAAPSIVKDVGDILALQKMLENKAPQTDNVTAVINGLKQGIELAQLANPNGNQEETGVLGIIKQLLPAFVGMGGGGQPNLMERITQSIPRPLPRPTPHPAPASAQIPAPAAQVTPAPAAQVTPAPAQITAEPNANPHKEPTMNFGLSMMIAMYKAPILDMAKTDFDTEKAAEIIVTRIPESYYPVCLDFTNKKDRLELVKMALPELFVIDPVTNKDYSEWTTKVLDSGKALLTEYFTPQSGEVIESTAQESTPVAEQSEEAK
jgi:hypothetical protein